MPAPPQRPPAGRTFHDLKRHIHGRLLQLIDLRRVPDLGPADLRRELRLVVERLVDAENPLLNRMERERLIDDVLDELLGFGPLEPLFHPSGRVEEVLIRGVTDVQVRRGNRWEAVDVQFADTEHLRQVLDRIVSRSETECAELKCGATVEALLANGFRVRITMPASPVEPPTVRMRREEPLPEEPKDIGSLVTPPSHLAEHYRRLFPRLVMRLHTEGKADPTADREALRALAVEVAEQTPLGDEELEQLVSCLVAAFFETSRQPR